MRTLLISLALLPAATNISELVYCPAPEIKSSEIKVDLREQKCLATMLYGESRGETERGMIAVAFTAVNRASNKTVCKVVLAPKQYSIFNDNPVLRAAALSLHLEPKQKNIIDKNSWKRSMKVAETVLKRKVSDPTNGSTHYVAYKSLKYIPYWTKKLERTVKIDNHTFFKEGLGKNIRIGYLSEKILPLT